MSREEIIKLMREAGMQGMLTDVICTHEELSRFAALVAEHERKVWVEKRHAAWHEGFEAGRKTERAFCAAICDEKQEPVAFINVENQKLEWAKVTSWHTPTIANLPKIPLYTAPPKHEWVGLTDEELDVIYEQHHNQYGECESPNFGYERAIEQTLKEKNHG